MVEPAREGPQTRPPTPGGWLRPLLLAVVGAVSAGLLAGGLYAIFRSDGAGVTAPPTPPGSASTSAAPTTPTATTATTTPTATTPTATTPATTPTATPKPPTVPTQSSAVPVYYIASQPGGATRLFREFHKVAYTTSRGAAAVTEMLTAAPADEDYRSLWPASTVFRRYALAGDTVTLDFAAAPTTRLAVQQLVYTVTAVEAANHITKVRITVNRVSRGVFTRTSHVFVEGAVWVTAPFDGAQVGSPVTVEGVATVFEATVPWEVRRAGVPIRRGVAQAKVGAPSRGTWKVLLSLPPGTYEFRGLSRSPDDGHIDAIDTKTFTVT